METNRNLTISFYDDYGTLSIYAKEDDTQRVIIFELVDNSILLDRTDLHIYVRGKFSDGSIISPFEIKSEYITDNTITFNIPDYFLIVPGIAKCDLAFVKGSAEIDEVTGEIVNTDIETQILSTHNFNIYIEGLPTNGAHLSPYQENQMDAITKALLKVEEAAEISDEYVRQAREAAASATTSATEANETLTEVEAIADSIGRLTFNIDSNGHLIWDFDYSSTSDPMMISQAINELQNGKLDKAGGTIDGDIVVEGTVTVNGDDE